MWNHNRRIGSTEKLSVNNAKHDLRGTAKITVRNKATEQIIKKDDGFNMSMGLDASKENGTVIKYHASGTRINNRRVKGACYTMHNVILEEMTVCQDGRDPFTGMKIYNSKITKEELTVIKNRKSKANESWDDDSDLDYDIEDELDTALEDDFILNSDSDDDDDSDDGDFDDEDTLDAPDFSVKNSTKKGSLSLSKCMSLSKKHPEAEDVFYKAFDEGWTESRIKNALKVRQLENALPGPARIKLSPQGISKNIEALVTRRMASKSWEDEVSTSDYQHSILNSRFGEKTADETMGRDPISLKEFMVLSAKAMGTNHYDAFSNIQNMANDLGRVNRNRVPAEFNGTIRNSGGFSSFDMPNLFERVSRFVVESAWKVKGADFATSMCFETSHEDFRPVERIRPAGGSIWQGLDHDGRIKSAGYGDEIQYTAELDTKAQYVMFNRKAILNDDFNIIAELFNLMLEGAIIVPDVKLVKKMLKATGAAASGAFFETNYNDFAGAGTALTAANIGPIMDRISQHTINKGSVDWINDIDDEWKIVVGSRAQERSAWEIFNQKNLISPSDNLLRQGQDNYWYGKMETRRFRQLLNPTINNGAGRDDMWWLWPSTRQFSPYAISYLKGNTAPVSYSIEAPFDMLGFGMAGYFDIEINERERQAIHRLRPTGSL